MELDFPSSNRESAPEAPKKSAWDKIKESRLAKALIVAGAVHAPAINETAAKGVQSVVESMRGPWHMPNMVLEPQSTEEQKSIQERVAMRKARIDPAALDAYKKEAEKKIDAGEPVSFKRMQFDLERLNGMSAEEVASAEKKADALIEKYAQEIGDDLDEQEMKKISIELYGPGEAYTWGQASAVRYFNGGERNCVGVARAQGIVMEGVLAHLAPEKRSRWHQATQMVKQHEMAALEHIGADGKRDALYILEGDATRKWKEAQEEPGTATIPMEVITKAMVSTKPVEVKAAGIASEVSDSPELNIVTDEPVSLNLNIKGKLKGADFVRTEAEREGLKVRKMTNEEMAAQEERIHATEKIVEFDIEKEEDPHAPLDLWKMSDKQIKELVDSDTQDITFRSLGYGKRIDPKTAKLLLSGKGKKVIDIHELLLNDAIEISKYIKDMPKDTTIKINLDEIFTGVSIEEMQSKELRLIYEQLSKTKGKVIISAYAYAALMNAYPDVLKNTHIMFDSHEGIRALEFLRKELWSTAPTHHLLKDIDRLIKNAP